MKKSTSKLDPVFKLAKKRVDTLLKAITADPASPDTQSDTQAHALRVCAKKLRALLQLYRPCRSKAAVKFVDQFIKDLADCYSDERDANVQYEILCRASKVISPQYEKNMQPLLSYFFMVKQRAMGQSVTIDVHAGFEHILKAWQEKLTSEAAPEVVPGVDFTYRKSRKLARAAKLTEKDDAYHHCRKWLKYYLYQLRMLVPHKHVKKDAHLTQLAILGDVLGAFHDCCVLEKALNCLLLDSKKVNSDKTENPDMEIAILLMLTWLAEQKCLDKAQCHKLFKRVFVHTHNPVNV